MNESWHALKTSLAQVLFYFCVSFFLFLLSWIPFVGILFSVLQIAFSAWFFAFGVCTYPLILDRTGVSKVFGWGWNNAGRLIGFGLPSLIPLFGVLCGPFLVVGATLMYLDFKNAK